MQGRRAARREIGFVFEVYSDFPPDTLADAAALSMHSGWKSIAQHELISVSASTRGLGLALAEVTCEGTVCGVNGPAGQRWGWQAEDRIPEALRGALAAVPAGTTQALSIPQGGLALLGTSLPGCGWLLFGYDPAATKEPTSTFKSLIEKTPVFLVRLGADGTVSYVGSAAAAVTGYAIEQIIGQPFWLDIVHPEDRWKLTQAVRHAVEEQREASVSARFLTPQQELRLVELYLMPAARQAQVAVEVLVFDVTEQGEVEAVLLQTEMLYRTFLEQSPMGILYLDAAGVVTFENHSFRQIVGEGVESAWIGHRIIRVPGLDPRLKPLLRRMLREGVPVRGEAVTYRQIESGRTAHLVVHGSPIRQPGGEIVGGVMMIEDVTEQRRREEELLLRDRYEHAEAALREAVFTDFDETVFLQETATIIGETARADRVHLLIHHGGEGGCITRAVWVRDETLDPFSLYIRSGDYPALRGAVVQGQSLHLHEGAAPETHGLLDLTEACEVLWAPFYDAGRLGGFVLFERLSPPDDASVASWLAAEQRLMDHLVRLFETLWSWVQVGQRYRLTVATIDDCLFTFAFARNTTRRYLFVTPQVEALTGFRADEVLARSGGAWSWIAAVVHEADRERVQAHDERLRSGRESRLVYRIRHRDGTERWLSEDVTPHRDATGRVTASGILMDVTEQKDAEEILLSAREQVASASRLKNMFVAMMSHALRSPLGVVNGFAELLATELAEWEAQSGQALPSQVYEFTEAVRQNARRLLRLVDDVFVLANVEAGTLRLERVRIPLHALLQQCAGKVAVQLAAKGVALKIDLDADVPSVDGDAQRFEQVFDNLLSNAAKFTDEGEVTVRTRVSDGEVVVEVIDTGVGIDASYREQLFTPFLQEDHRLNRRFEGTGLGLALTKRLLDLMGGRIEVESEKGEGSTFRIILPVAG